MTDSICKIDVFDTKRWFEEFFLHRLDGPAVICSNGAQEWWVHGKRHRLDGPAIEGFKGYKEWYIHGVQLSKEEFDRHPLAVFHRLSLEHV
jgi:hypothetical protein